MEAGANLLVTCGGRWVGMVLQLKQAMSSVPALRNGRILIADRAPLTPAGCFADGSLVVPSVEHPEYVDNLLDVCRRQGVRVVLPIIDIDLRRLAPHAGRFADAGATLVCPPSEVVELCLDKTRFAAFAREYHLLHPCTYMPDKLTDDLFPLFMKRRMGFGSIGAGLCRSLGDAKRALQQDPDLIFQEYVNNTEISVDAFVSRTGRCTVRVPRVRDKVIGGEAVQTHTIRSERIADLADRTLVALAARGLRGPANVQLFAGDSPMLIEVNPRLGSASVLSNVASDGRLFVSVLGESCGETHDGDPDSYRELSLHRFLGDVFHDGLLPVGLVPSNGGPR